VALERILSRTRSDVARRMREVPLETFRSRLPPSGRSLAEALRRPWTGFILECKKASPSQGVLRPDYDAALVAAEYGGHADAISVLTNAPFFQGALEHMRQVSGIAKVPVLCKDFVLDPYQVFEARAFGADAILLMLSVLDDQQYAACTGAAREAGLETLTEVHTPAELERAVALGAPIIGINNRDLRTLKVDLDTVRALAPRVPGDRLVVCESGIDGRDQVLELASLVDGFLVGGSLMRAAELPQAVRRLVYGVTKVCGLTRLEDASAAWMAGATHGGMIFAPESPRRISGTTALELRDIAPLDWVGVFVNERPARIAALADRLRLAAVQLHGEEDPASVAELRRSLDARTEIWKAVRVRDQIPTLESTGADRVLVDTWRSGKRGGTGQRLDWTLVRDHPQVDRMILSGGLTPEVAAEAAQLGVWGLDVNSGVETRPGVKSAERLRAFFTARRGPGRQEAQP